MNVSLINISMYGKCWSEACFYYNLIISLWKSSLWMTEMSSSQTSWVASMTSKRTWELGVMKLAYRNSQFLYPIKLLRSYTQKPMVNSRVQYKHTISEIFFYLYYPSFLRAHHSGSTNEVTLLVIYCSFLFLNLSSSITYFTKVSYLKEGPR